MKREGIIENSVNKAEKELRVQMEKVQDPVNQTKESDLAVGEAKLHAQNLSIYINQKAQTLSMGIVLA